MKITNNIQNYEINKEKQIFKIRKGHWAGPTRQRSGSRPRAPDRGARYPERGKQRRRSRNSSELELVDGGISGEGNGTLRFLSTFRII
jgi:hypothetical protein